MDNDRLISTNNKNWQPYPVDAQSAERESIKCFYLESTTCFYLFLLISSSTRSLRNHRASQGEETFIWYMGRRCSLLTWKPERERGLDCSFCRAHKISTNILLEAQPTVKMDSNWLISTWTLLIRCEEMHCL